jgi:hypothetical protein
MIFIRQKSLVQITPHIVDFILCYGLFESRNVILYGGRIPSVDIITDLVENAVVNHYIASDLNHKPT